MRLEELYQHHAKAVYRFAYWLCGNPTEAEDITSETFLRAWCGKTTLRATTVRAYLFTIARNLFLEQRRRNRATGALSHELADGAPGPSERAESSEELRAARQALQRLPEIDRAAVLLRAQEEMSYEDIARSLGISVSSAKVKVHRARLKLSALLQRPDIRRSSL